MTYNIPLIIPILATGYLLTIYLLLVLAQRNSKESPGSESSGISKPIYKKEVLMTRKVSEASGMH
ncbi:MAG: hypothetical protein JOZ78_00395 [Chroococcidiopsidaceae cyanobacterium CP_BM_ER_R8_30]|nr:hypothetical protein [Chroococcidiopsidaceae cyanobacterium CP_BM_ER_R8_30]